MRRSFYIYDLFYRFTHAVKRNRAAVVIYALISLLFVIIGVAVGVNVDDKAGYVNINRAPLFSFLRGDSGVVAFFFVELFTDAVYALFAASMFLGRVTAFLSLAPCMYVSYSLGIRACIVLTVYSAPAIPMIFVFYVPVCIVVTIVTCMLSYKCFRFAAMNTGVLPSNTDVREHYRACLPYFVCVLVCALFKAISIGLFGSALIGV